MIFFIMISKEEISLSATDNIFVHHFGHKSDAKSTVVCMYCCNPVIILKNEGQIPRAKRLGKSVLLLNSEAIRHFRYCNETLFTLIFVCQQTRLPATVHYFYKSLDSSNAQNPDVTHKFDLVLMCSTRQKYVTK